MDKSTGLTATTWIRTSAPPLTSCGFGASNLMSLKLLHV